MNGHYKKYTCTNGVPQSRCWKYHDLSQLSLTTEDTQSHKQNRISWYSTHVCFFLFVFLITKKGRVYKLFESGTPKFGLGLLFFTEEESRTPTFKILVRTLMGTARSFVLEWVFIRALSLSRYSSSLLVGWLCWGLTSQSTIFFLVMSGRSHHFLGN